MNETDAEESLLTVKEESSDESTVISSQTSTLTRNQGEKSENAIFPACDTFMCADNC